MLKGFSRQFNALVLLFLSVLMGFPNMARADICDRIWLEVD